MKTIKLSVSAICTEIMQHIEKAGERGWAIYYNTDGHIEVLNGEEFCPRYYIPGYGALHFFDDLLCLSVAQDCPLSVEEYKDFIDEYRRNAADFEERINVDGVYKKFKVEFV